MLPTFREELTPILLKLVQNLQTCFVGRFFFFFFFSLLLIKFHYCSWSIIFIGFISSCFNLSRDCTFPGICPFFSRLSISLHIIAYNNILRSFVFLLCLCNIFFYISYCLGPSTSFLFGSG